jgi:hypothetical protein
VVWIKATLSPPIIIEAKIKKKTKIPFRVSASLYGLELFSTTTHLTRLRTHAADPALV